MLSRAEIAIAGLVIIIVWLQFARWVPVQLQTVLFVMLIVIAIAIIGTGWRRWVTVRQDRNIASWRTKTGLCGLIADTLALILPFVAFLYAFVSFNYMHRPSAVVWVLVPTSLFLSLCGFVCGIVSPFRIRFLTAMGGLITGCPIVSVPIGIL